MGGCGELCKLGARPPLVKRLRSRGVYARRRCAYRERPRPDTKVVKWNGLQIRCESFVGSNPTPAFSLRHTSEIKRPGSAGLGVRRPFQGIAIPLMRRSVLNESPKTKLCSGNEVPAMF